MWNQQMFVKSWGRVEIVVMADRTLDELIKWETVHARDIFSVYKNSTLLEEQACIRASRRESRINWHFDIVQ